MSHHAPEDGTIQVVVRVRPWNDQEKAAGTVPVVHTDIHSKVVSVVRRGERVKQTKYSGFKEVFTAFSSQREVYDVTVRPLVDRVLEGFSCVALAYGQTGTGKTWTMEGDTSSCENWGFIPRSVEHIFGALGELDRFESSRVTVSYLEIFNEELFDLLLSEEVKEVERPKLRVVEDPSNRGVFCMGLREQEVVSVEEVVELVQAVEVRRRLEETKMNKRSSRSHCLFTVAVTAREVLSGDGGMVMERTGRLNLVDLAGSESAKTQGGHEDRGRERKSINQSLLALGRVITALQAVSASKDTDLSGRVPYRESKLTRLLQDALGGRSNTCLVATCSPSELAVDETVSTLGYAQRACTIRNRPPAQNQLMAGSRRSLSPGPGIVVDGAVPWSDAQLRLDFMDSQVREAQYELTQQRELQKEATARALAAENRVTGLEDEADAERARAAAHEAKVSLLQSALAKRHVHVKELRHFLRAHSNTESALQVQVGDLLRALRSCEAQSEDLQRSLESNADDAEARRDASVAFFSAHDDALDRLKARLREHEHSEDDARTTLSDQVSRASRAAQADATALTASLVAMESRVAEDASRLADAISLQVSTNISGAQDSLTAAKASADETVGVAATLAAGIDGRLVNLSRDLDADETSLLNWSDASAVATTANGEGLRARAGRELSNIREASQGLDARGQEAIMRFDDDAVGMDTLLEGLHAHKQAAKAQAATATAAAESATKALEDSAGRFETTTEALGSALETQERGHAGAALGLEEVAAAMAVIAAATSRQAEDLASDAAAISETTAAVVDMVNEQKAKTRSLVEVVVAQVRDTLEEQSRALSETLDAAVANLNERLSARAEANSALASVIDQTFTQLHQSCVKTQATMESWSECDRAAITSIKDSIASLSSARKRSEEDAAASTIRFQVAAAEAEDLKSRTSDEIAAVAALKEGSLAGAAAASTARQATADVLEARAAAVRDWEAADQAATAATLSSFDSLKALRANFLPRVQESLDDVRTALTESMVADLAHKLEDDHSALASAVASRLSLWRDLDAASRKALLGDGVGLAPILATEVSGLSSAVTASSAAHASAAEASVDRIRSMGERAMDVEADITRLVEGVKEDTLRFAHDVSRVDTDVPRPPPLLPTVYSDTVASTRPHEDLVNDLHGGNVASTENEMLQRVADLLERHQQAQLRGDLPFRDESLLETSEGNELYEEI